MRVGLAYLAVAWIVLQVIDIMAGILAWPAWFLELGLFAIATGFPIALLLAWFYDVTPEGVRESSDVDVTAETPGIGGRKIDFVIIGALCIVILWLALKDRIMSPPDDDLPQAIPLKKSSPPRSSILLLSYLS